MNLSAENIGAIRELVRSGYPLKARDAKDLLGHNDHLVELLEARSRLMLGVEIERDQLRAEVAGLRTGYEAYERVNAELKAENEALRNAAAPLEPVNGDQLPAINSKVLIHLSSCDAWVEHTVVGYYAWEDLGANEYLHRVFIRVRDDDGYLNARLLKDVRDVAALGQGEQS